MTVFCSVWLVFALKQSNFFPQEGLSGTFMHVDGKKTGQTVKISLTEVEEGEVSPSTGHRTPLNYTDTSKA